MDAKQNSHPVNGQKNHVTLSILKLSGIATILALLYLFNGTQEDLLFVLQFRIKILITILLVGIATGVSTLLFQTLTQNRILTPAIMGLESLFVLIQTVILFFFGTEHIAFSDRVVRFIVDTLLMMTFSTLLYRWLLNIKRYSINIILLSGMVCGTLFSSGAALLQRLIAPGEFAILQSRIFSVFTRSDYSVLTMTGTVIIITMIPVWFLRHDLDVISLGRDNAIALGINYDKWSSGVLLLIALLVAMSTILAGPLTFLGLLAAHLSYRVITSWRHAFLLSGIILTSVIILLTGQLLLNTVLNMSGALSIVIEFFGGILCTGLLLRKYRD